MPELTTEQMMSLIPRLGKEKDISLAAEYGVTRQRIKQLRDDRGIARHQPDFRKGFGVNVGTHITKKDERDMNKAIKKTEDKNKSEYVRTAIRSRNKEVLDNG